ncbi:MAG TPA: tol-pal system protein YbgF [Oleiagrimonas sp.]|nr:tol-pal system protein YbgF [Oleiagrimonas sp.]
MKLPVANKPWVRLTATAAVCAVVAFCVIDPAMAQFVPARQDSTAVAASTPAASASRDGGGGSAMSMVNQIQMLKQQNRELLGQVEELRHQLQQLKEINKEQYLVLDRRIKRLAGKSPSTSGSKESGQTPAKASTAAPASAQSASDTSEAAQGASAPAGASTVLTANPDAQKAYDAAFKALRAGNFVASSRGFRAFIEQYPQDKLTPNAWYWLGESYYVTQNYKQALHAFEQVVTRFPDSRKTPGALLKKGYAQYALKQVDKAQATLQSVIAKYPNSSVADLATQRLEDIQLQQQLH